jgi:prepilin-type N-terminal cleavage/methylation domain-containing protein
MKRHTTCGARGLTLLETLIATAILATIAGACVPVVARAMALLRRPSEPRVGQADLSIVADAFMADPAAFGVDHEEMPNLVSFQMAWPAGAALPPPTSSVNVRVLRAADAEVDHAWVLFECEGTRSMRWLAVPEREDGEKERQP